MERHAGVTLSEYGGATLTVMDHTVSDDELRHAMTRMQRALPSPEQPDWTIDGKQVVRGEGGWIRFELWAKPMPSGGRAVMIDGTSSMFNLRKDEPTAR